MKDSRLPGLYRLELAERIDELERRGWLAAADAATLRQGGHVLTPVAAEKMVENVVGSFGLPFAIAPNFIVNAREYIVPLVVEEPSIVAALSGAARLARESGGFEAALDESLLAGQIHLTEVDDPGAATRAIEAHQAELIELANDVHPRLVQRGGGVRELGVRTLSLDDETQAVVVHLYVDTCDAMGANTVNTLCEAVAPRIAELAGGQVALRILSNLADRSLVTARVRYSVKDSGERDAIVRAGMLADADPYRAATHNKGVMNGIDALAIATGNDWRAIEAGAHAYAAESGRYRSLTSWRAAGDKELIGEIRVPLKLGTVGGSVDVNPAAALGLRLSGVASAAELAMLMAAVGLAQNFAAIRALATAGIQQGHMRLHARTVAAAAGVPEHLFDEVVAELAASGEVKDWKAREILASRQIRSTHLDTDGGSGIAAGKLILLGEHAVVYGKHALAIPIPDAVRASATTGKAVPTLSIPDWGLRRELTLGADGDGIDAIVQTIADALSIDMGGVGLRVRSALPRAMGLGSSAAIAVAVTRALADLFEIDVDDERVNAIAFDCEKLAHGTPSGVDNALATFARPILFQRESEVQMLELAEAPAVVVACSHNAGLTAEQVTKVRVSRERQPAAVDAVFESIDALAVSGADALRAGDWQSLGAAMNICHGMLNALQVSTPELERMVAIARESGALGAKLTGAGGGGSIVALCPGRQQAVRSALQAAGYRIV